jgi:hypothetical protein
MITGPSSKFYGTRDNLDQTRRETGQRAGRWARIWQWTDIVSGLVAAVLAAFAGATSLAGLAGRVPAAILALSAGAWPLPTSSWAVARAMRGTGSAETPGKLWNWTPVCRRRRRVNHRLGAWTKSCESCSTGESRSRIWTTSPFRLPHSAGRYSHQAAATLAPCARMTSSPSRASSAGRLKPSRLISLSTGRPPQDDAAAGTTPAGIGSLGSGPPHAPGCADGRDYYGPHPGPGNRGRAQPRGYAGVNAR